MPYKVLGSVNQSEIQGMEEKDTADFDHQWTEALVFAGFLPRVYVFLLFPHWF